METLIQILPSLIDLSKKICDGKYYDYYPSLKTKKRRIDNWWNSLNSDLRMDVGSAAIHFRKMTPNYKWNTNVNYIKLTKSQQKIIQYVFSRKKYPFCAFDLHGLFKT